MGKRVSGNFFTDAKRVLGWLWKKRPQGKGPGFFHRLWEAMNR
jgi:hypothetical protein